MADVELPEIEIDDDRDPFKRRIALVVVAITLFGTLVAVLEHKAGNHEEVAARDAQRLAVSGLGSRVATDTRFNFQQDVLTQSKVLQREVVNAQRTRGITDQQRNGDAQRLRDVRALIAPLSPLLSDDKYNDESAGPGRLSADENVATDLATLRQTALVTVQNTYGNKAGGYVAVITVLAVALFLVGLSLTVGGAFRLFLVVPGIVIALWCVVWTASIARRPVHRAPDSAIKEVAEGNRLASRAFAESDDAAIRKVLTDALKTYDRAVEDAPFFGPAYFQRARTRFTLGSPDLTGQLLSTTDPQALKAAVQDEETALKYDNLNEIEIVDDLSFDYVLANRPSDAVTLAENVLSRDDKLPRVWFNLGVANVLQGDENGAKDAYDHALGLLTKDNDPFTRSQLYAGAMSDLEQVQRIRPGLDKSVRRFEDLIANAQLKQVLPDAPDAGSDAQVTNLTFKPEGERVRAEFDFTNIPKDSAIGFIWYYRASAKDGFLAQADDAASGMSRNVGFLGDGSGKYFVETAPRACPLPGEYRLDVYAGGKRIASDSTTVDVGDLGPSPQLESSDLIGANVCRPADWEVDTSDPQAFAFKSPDGSAQFSVASVLLDSNDVASADPKDVEDELIRQLLPGVDDSDIEDFVMSDAECRNGVLESGGTTTNVTAFYSPADFVVRVAISTVHREDEFKPVNAMLDTLHFTDLPSNAQDPNVHIVSEHGVV